MSSETRKIVNYEKNRKGEEKPVYQSPKEDDFKNYANFLIVKAENGERVLSFKVFSYDQEMIWISDILIPKGEHEGYGHILLKTLIKIAKEHDFKRIEGQMFYDTQNAKCHRDRLVDFYEQYGFSIIENDMIVKIL